MSVDQTAQARAYHHGDLRRALLRAAAKILSAEGLSAVSMRAVAREAGVSSGAPYHHFADKAELLDALSEEGWKSLSREVTAKVGAKEVTLLALGMAYVEFAHENPALFRVMWDAAARPNASPETTEARQNAWRTALACAPSTGVAGASQLGVLAILCTAHGLAEISRLSAFDDVKACLGGEANFLRAVFETLGRPA